MNQNETDFFLSMGTLATLVGCSRCTKLEMIGNSFALWAMTCGKNFSSWQKAWNEFYAN